MELKELVQRSLIDVLTAIHDAQVEWKGSIDKGAINPVWNNTSKLHEHVHKMEFDIAVTAGSAKSGSAKAGINVLGVDIGGSGALESQNSSVSRIKFTIPVVPPVQVVMGVDLSS